MATKLRALDESKPYQEVFGELGQGDWRYKQGNVCYDDAKRPIGTEGPEPKGAPGSVDEAALRAEIEAKVRAEIAAEAAPAKPAKPAKQPKAKKGVLETL